MADQPTFPSVATYAGLAAGKYISAALIKCAYN